MYKSPQIKRKRAPQNERDLDKLLQFDTKKQLVSIYWGKDKRLLNFVDKPYLTTMLGAATTLLVSDVASR